MSKAKKPILPKKPITLILEDEDGEELFMEGFKDFNGFIEDDDNNKVVFTFNICPDGVDKPGFDNVYSALSRDAEYLNKCKAFLEALGKENITYIEQDFYPREMDFLIRVEVELGPHITITTKE
jgi:hypothetical protein